MSKIKILLANRDSAGVFYWRTYLPSLMLNKNHSDEFDITINQDVNFNDFEYLKQFNIIHTHQGFNTFDRLQELKDFFDANGIVTIVDLDDNPSLHPTHPMYHSIKAENLDLKIFNVLSYVDAVSTTTPYFANVLKKYNKEVMDFQNSATKTITPQFSNKRKPNDKIRFGYIGGSSHLKDIEQLTDMFQVFSSDKNIQEKATFSLHGFDLRGSSRQSMINPDLMKEISSRGLGLRDVMVQFNKVNGDINKMSTIPDDLKDKYKNHFVQYIEKPISPQENVWVKYEEIFTDNYKLIKDENYLQYLKKYNDEIYDDLDSQPYKRFYTKNINTYMNHYDEIDVSLIPLVNNEFNLCKSPLKLVEAYLKGCLPIVYNVPLYTQYITNGVNGFVAKDERDFTKIVKRIINNPSLITEMTENFINSVKDEFDLEIVTKKRVQWYKELLEKKNNK